MKEAENFSLSLLLLGRIFHNSLTVGHIKRKKENFENVHCYYL